MLKKEFIKQIENTENIKKIPSKIHSDWDSYKTEYDTSVKFEPAYSKKGMSQTFRNFNRIDISKDDDIVKFYAANNDPVLDLNLKYIKKFIFPQLVYND